jgi:hypothetical protein
METENDIKHDPFIKIIGKDESNKNKNDFLYSSSFK